MLPPGMERRPEEGSSSASGANGMGGGGAGGRRTLGSSRQAVLQFEEAQRIIVLDAVRTEMMPLMKMERDARGGGAADEAGAGMALKREGRQSRMIGGKLDPGRLGSDVGGSH